jgi:hypothetical protein
MLQKNSMKCLNQCRTSEIQQSLLSLIRNRPTIRNSTLKSYLTCKSYFRTYPTLRAKRSILFHWKLERESGILQNRLRLLHFKGCADTKMGLIWIQNANVSVTSDVSEGIAIGAGHNAYSERVAKKSIKHFECLCFMPTSWIGVYNG